MNMNVREITREEALAELVKAQEELEAFRKRVAVEAMALAREHDWCSVVTVALEKLGVDEYIPVDRTGEDRTIVVNLPDFTVITVAAEHADGTVDLGDVERAVISWIRTEFAEEHYDYED